MRTHTAGINNELIIEFFPILSKVFSELYLHPWQTRNVYYNWVSFFKIPYILK